MNARELARIIAEQPDAGELPVLVWSSEAGGYVAAAAARRASVAGPWVHRETADGTTGQALIIE